MNNRLSLLVAIISVSLTSLVACGSDKTNEKANEVRSEFPKLERVLTELDKEIKTTPEGAHFNIAKKPQGYYLQLIDNESDELSEEYLVWSAEKKEFSVPDIKDQLKSLESYFPGYSQTEIDNYLKTRSLNGFDQTVRKGEYDFSLFSGYDGWSSDVIEYLDGVEGLPLKDIENLARAYDSQANNCIHPGQGGTVPEFAKDYKEGNYTKIEKDRIAKFEELADKSLALYDQIIEQDPNYDTYLIGNVRLKKANNCMNYYLILKSVKEDGLAQKYLKQAKYPKAFETIAKMYLDGCGKRSFLFTNGDSDTYPLWYVQDKLGHRQDVMVVNLSLLAAPWYVTMVQDVNSLNTALSSQQCFDNQVAYFVPDPNIKNSEITPVEELFSAFNKYASKPMGNSPEMLKVGKSFVMNNNGKTRYLDLTRNYYLASELFMIDMIHNNPQYGVYFASPIGLKDFGWKRDYLKRLLVVELTYGDNKGQFDSLSGDQMESYMATVTPEFLNGVDNFSGTMLIHYLTYFQNLSIEDPNSAAELAKIFDKQVPNALFYDVEDLGNLELKLHIQTVIDENLLGEESYKFCSEYKGILEGLTINEDNMKESHDLLDGVLHIVRLMNYSKEADQEGILNIVELIDQKLADFEKSSLKHNYKWQFKSFAALRVDLEQLRANMH